MEKIFEELFKTFTPDRQEAILEGQKLLWKNLRDICKSEEEITAMFILLKLDTIALLKDRRAAVDGELKRLMECSEKFGKATGSTTELFEVTDERG